MKFISFLFLFFAIVFLGCTDPDSPEKQAAGFLESINQRDFSRAKEYCTERSEPFIDMLQAMSVSPDSATSGLFPKVVIRSTRIDGDTAWVTYMTEDRDLSDLILIRKNDEWKVDLAKE